METILISLTKEELQNLIIDSVTACLKYSPAPVPNIQNQIEQPISQKEAEAFIGCSRQKLLRLRKQGKIKALVLGGSVMYLKSQLLEAMKH